MNCNTEDIQRIAEAVAKLVQGGMRQKQSESQEAETMAEFEYGFREALRQLGAAAPGIHLSGLQRTPESEIACQRLAHKHDEARQAVAYFSNGSQRMRYDRLHENGWVKALF